MKKPPPQFTRRQIIKGISASSLVPLLGANLIGCSDGSDRRPPTDPGPDPEPPIESVPADFNHGVASGDPLADRVILWTRVTPESDGNVVVDWEIASDEDFTNVIGSGSGSTTAEVDYTVKVDADGLDPATTYFYRFLTGDKVSPVGRTRTVSTDALASATFAVVSCSNYPAGFFNVYREIANQDLDAVLHLGDYIYEYEKDGYASERAEEFGRVVMPETELLSLGDYRTRYAQYRTDADLQDCHAAHPFVIVWDDHEIANDAWADGAENHDPETEGDYSVRRAEAIQAWYEWLPVRPPASEQDIIYRGFQYGDLVDLIMLDTRHVGRDLQVDYADYVNGGVIDSVAANAAIGDSGRTLLGAGQLDWVKGRLTDSTARWQVLGSQIIMARQPLTEPLVRALTPGLAGDDPIGEAVTAVLQMQQAKNTPEEERTEEQQALLDGVIPLSTDQWDGYDFEREDLLNHAAQLQSRLVVVTGDSHNSWASQLTTADGAVVGVEFAGTSVSSPGAEGVIGLDNAELFGPLAVGLIDDLNYADLVRRGYLAVTFSPDDVTCDYRYVTAIDSTDYAIDEENARSFTVSRDDLLLT